MTRDLLVWQFDLVWSLAQLHLDELTDADVQWEPAQVTWTVRRGADEVWRPDFTGDAAVAQIRTLASQWREVLAGASDHALATDVPYPWDPPKTLAHLASWVNVELTKNIAELGQLRLLRAATPGV